MVISVLILQVSRYDDNIHRTEIDLTSLRRDVRMLTNRVHELKMSRDVNDMRTVYEYDHLEEAHTQVQF